MKDLKEETLAGLLGEGIPADEELPEAQRATAHALRAVKAGDAAQNPRMQRTAWQCAEEHALCWRKWGLAYVQDLTAWLLFCEGKAAGQDDHVAGTAAESLLPAVDWELLDGLFRKNWEDYRAGRRPARTDKGIAQDIAGLEWALGKRGIPGVRQPGDLHHWMTAGRPPPN